MRNWIASVFLSAATLLGAERTVAPDALSAFTFQGKPIHPGVVSEFEVWLSDGDPPRVKTVDLESCSTSNKNFDPPKKEISGYLTCKQGDAWFGYKYVGVTPAGTYVVTTASGGGGGTMVAMYVYLLRFDKEEYLTFKDGNQRPVVEQRIVLKCVGQIVLGDRDDGTVELRGQTLTLGKSRYRDKAVVYELL